MARQVICRGPKCNSDWRVSMRLQADRPQPGSSSWLPVQCSILLAVLIHAVSALAGRQSSLLLLALARLVEATRDHGRARVDLRRVLVLLGVSAASLR